MVAVGEPAPDFTAFDQTGTPVRLADLRGQRVWLWFFTAPGGTN